MRCHLLLFVIGLLSVVAVNGQDAASKANTFISLLDQTQKTKALYAFDAEERYRFAYVPLNDRKGISMNELTTTQQQAAIALLKTSVSEETVKKITDIMQLDLVLKELEHRSADDNYRDPGKYFITIFGTPSTNNIWGWRFEGHHVSFLFSSEKNKFVSGTPSFLGSNPAIVQSGPQKNKEVLKEETDKGLSLLHALSAEELKKAIVATTAPNEIVTAANRKAMIEHPEGIRYNEMSAAAQQQFLQLISLYIHRYTKLFAEDMLKQIQQAGLNNLWFTWAGDTNHTPGKPYYYRVQGPTIIIEYDNSQNNANHIHTVIRDLTNDFGGDVLLEHYRSAH